MLNKIEIEGILDKEPKYAKTVKGHSMVKLFMKISTSSSYQGKTYFKTSFVPIVAWGKIADSALELKIKKDDEIRVEGILQFQTWETAEGGKKGALAVEAKSISKVENPMPDIKVTEEEDLF